MAKKTKLEKMADAIMGWIEEDEDNRAFICFYADKKGQYTSCATHGLEVDIAESIVNEMYSEPDLAHLITKSVKVYHEVLKKEQEEQKKKKTPKRMLS